MSDLVKATRAAERKREPVADKLYKEGTAFSLALADRVGVDRFIRAAVTSFKTTPKLAKCSWDSVVGGLYVAAQLGLEIGGPRGLAYLVPYGSEASLVIGYKGYVDLFYNAGAKSVDWFIVRDGDEFRIGSNSDAGRVYEWAPVDLDDSRKPIGAVAQVRTATNGLVWEYMTERQILLRRPQYWQSTPWAKWPEQMWLKTVLRQLSKRVRMSTELALAADADDTVQRRMPGLEQHVVERVPVEGDVAGKATNPPPDEDAEVINPEDDWEAQERAEQSAWADAQDAMERGGETP